MPALAAWHTGPPHRPTPARTRRVREPTSRISDPPQCTRTITNSLASDSAKKRTRRSQGRSLASAHRKGTRTASVDSQLPGSLTCSRLRRLPLARAERVGYTAVVQQTLDLQGTVRMGHFGYVATWCPNLQQELRPLALSGRAAYLRGFKTK